MSPSNAPHLPNELILCIMVYIRPWEIESFALCNKAIHNASQAVIREHQQLKQRYSRTQLGRPRVAGFSSPAFHGGLPLAFFEQFLSEPQIALYPVKLQIGDSNIEGPNSADENVGAALEKLLATWSTELVK